MRNEPVISAAVVSSVVAAVITLVVAFGVDLSEEQVTAILGVVGVVGPVALGLWQRNRVTPV